MSGDPSQRPFTAEELENVRVSIFPSFASFREEDWSLASTDVPALCEKLNWPPRTPEQTEAYKKYWDENFNGRLPFAVVRPILFKCHTSGEFVRACITGCDKNRDGLIDKEEFEVVFDIFEKHHPGEKLSYEEFVAAADSNKDGKVSIDEAVAWVEKKVSF